MMVMMIRMKIIIIVVMMMMMMIMIGKVAAIVIVITTSILFVKFHIEICAPGIRAVAARSAGISEIGLALCLFRWNGELKCSPIPHYQGYHSMEL